MNNEKQKIWLDMLELITDDSYMFVSEEEVAQLLGEYENELKERVKFKYFLDKDDEELLLIEGYLDNDYIYTFECRCNRKITKNDTINTVNIVSYGKYA